MNSTVSRRVFWGSYRNIQSRHAVDPPLASWSEPSHNLCLSPSSLTLVSPPHPLLPFLSCFLFLTHSPFLPFLPNPPSPSPTLLTFSPAQDSGEVEVEGESARLIPSAPKQQQQKQDFHRAEEAAHVEENAERMEELQVSTGKEGDGRQ